ncbi:MAG: thiol:disulfide interchange protein DsbA/DsbL [Xanthomonadales bacterium]|jgi:thiol:disulfide interchange protein DsbA|nr:thiol:disulfide interchange protein DsbA/DsbL [Xanthomonadales bacterium]
MLHRFLFAAALLMAAIVPASPAHAADPVQGVDYALIDPPVPPKDSGKIEVVEVFGYSCSHCAHFAPTMSQWKAKQPADVNVEYLPAAFGGIWEIYARVYYTAATMGVVDATHDALFKALHEERRPINKLEDIADFYAEHGVNKEQFLSTIDSFPVNAKLDEARRRAMAYGVDATPTMVVDGKYRIMAGKEGGFERMLQVVDFLIAKERAARKASTPVEATTP